MQRANTISFRIQHLAGLLHRQADQVLQEQLGIGMAQFRILKIVQSNPRLLQRDIADALGQTEASISRQVRLLHGKHLLATQLNPKNRREHVTMLTARGVGMTEAAAQVLQDFQTPFVDDLSDKQQIELLELLGHIEQRISQDARTDTDF